MVSFLCIFRKLRKRNLLMKRYYSLDIIRFILAVIIVMHHFQQNTGLFIEGGVNFFNGNIYYGYAVEAFFIISGFLAAGAKERTENTAFSKYFINKIIRIVPMAAVASIVYFIAMFIHYHRYGFWYAQVVPGIWRMLNTLLLSNAGGPVTLDFIGVGLNPPLWYVGVLLRCYIVFYLILWACKKLNVNPLYSFIAMVLFGTAIMQNGTDKAFLNEFHGRGLAAFFLGTVIYSLFMYASKKKTIIISAIVAFMFVILCIKDFEELLDYQWGCFTFVFFPAVILFFLSLEFLIRDGRSLPAMPKPVSLVFDYLGNVPYEIYVWHSPLIIIYSMIRVQEFHNFSPFTENNMICFLLFMAVFGGFTYYLMERPITRVLKNNYIK